MEHTKITLTYVAVAVGLALLAWVFSPQQITPESFLDQGDEFYPEFTDPNAATTLEVIAFDQQTATAKPFKVTNHNGLWSIPSHHNYPADGKDRLAGTAAGVIGIKKDDFRSDNVSDHESFGVVDPLDEAAGLVGRGQRVTIKDDDGVLADFIIGYDVADRQGFRYIRVPGQNRVYAARVNVDISTKFADWIETDLLMVEKFRIGEIILKDYSINERTRSVEQRDVLTLTGRNFDWKLKGKSTRLDSTKVQDMLATLDELHIVGVRPKPAGISTSLKQVGGRQSVSTADQFSLQAKGFFFSRDGDLLSNEGELQVTTSEGIRYTLRFGEVVYGTDEAVTAGSDQQTDNTGPAENRYLFITAEFIPKMLPEPPQPENKDFMNKVDSLWSDEDRQNRQKQTEFSKWVRKTEEGQIAVAELNARFAKWYYVISSESFTKLDLSRRDLISGS